MITVEEEYEGSGCTDVVGKDAMISTMQSVSTDQLREPLTVQTYLLRVVVHTLISRKDEYDTKTDPWDYQTGIKGKIIDTVMAQGTTRSRRLYFPEDLNPRVLGKEQNPKKNVNDAKAAEL